MKENILLIYHVIIRLLKINLLLLFFSGCSNLINEKNLKLYNGLYYNPENGKPYSGKVYKLYSNGLKMRDGFFDLGAIDGSYTYYNHLGSIITPFEEHKLPFTNGIKYHPNSDNAYWGMAYGNYQSGEKLYEVFYENGKIVGDYTYFNYDGSIKLPIFLSLLIRRGDVFYQQDSPEPYSGPVFDLWENGNKMLEGSYKNSIKDGRWIEWFKNGQPEKKYNYRYGQKHGNWAEWYDNGLLEIEGSYKEGKEDATWTYYYRSGKIEKIINYDNGWWNGKSQKWYPNGQMMEDLTYKDQVPVGKWQYWFENGQLKEEKNYDNGLLSGDWIQYYANGFMKQKLIYSAGKEIGTWVYWDHDGQKKEERTFLDGKKEGRWMSWYPNGMNKEERFYKNDYKSGTWTEWYNLQPREQRKYVEGKLDGARRKWYSSGQIKEEGNYKDGKESGKWTYYLEDGTIETSYDIKGNFLSRISNE